jgi:hypothetical protein
MAVVLTMVDTSANAQTAASSNVRIFDRIIGGSCRFGVSKAH